MSDNPDARELKLLLARAFDRAWDRYYRTGRPMISSEIARPALASRLVQMAQSGIKNEDQLAVSGLLHLNSLTPEEPPDLSDLIV